MEGGRDNNNNGNSTSATSSPDDGTSNNNTGMVDYLDNGTPPSSSQGQQVQQQVQQHQVLQQHQQRQPLTTTVTSPAAVVAVAADGVGGAGGVGVGRVVTTATTTMATPKTTNTTLHGGGRIGGGLGGAGVVGGDAQLLQTGLLSPTTTAGNNRTNGDGNSSQPPVVNNDYVQMLDHLQQREPSIPKIGSTTPNRRSASYNSNVNVDSVLASLTTNEIYKLQQLLSEYDPRVGNDLKSIASKSSWSVDSDYPEFGESTHAWAVFADYPKYNKRAGILERTVGTIIIVFQLFAYRLFAMEAIEDFQKGQVAVLIKHHDCINFDEDINLYNNGEDVNLFCEASYTDTLDAFVAYMMLGIFLSEDCLQAIRAIKNAPLLSSAQFFALLAGVEVICAFLSASIAVSYNLFIGEVTDAVSVGVGLLFIRELSSKTYSAIRNRGNNGKNQRQYLNFFICLSVLLLVGMIMDPLSSYLFAGYVQ